MFLMREIQKGVAALHLFSGRFFAIYHNCMHALSRVFTRACECLHIRVHLCMILCFYLYMEIDPRSRVRAAVYPFL